MGLQRSVLIRQAERLLDEQLARMGFARVDNPPVRSWEFWYEFEENPDAEYGLYKIIEFQPSGFNRDDIYQVAVNLIRRPYRDIDSPPRSYEHPERIVDLRLAPFLWEENSTATDFWWNFNSSIKQLQVAYEDISSKLVNIGIPVLRDLDKGGRDYYPDF